MTIDEIKNQLKDFNMNYISRDSKAIKDILSQLKRNSVEEGDQETAKDIWCLERILVIQDKYFKAYKSFKSRKYYRGWCYLEQGEIEYGFLSKHYKEEKNEYWLEFISKHTKQYQSIFPYSYFMSPEFLIKEIRCNICNQIINIRNPCGHKIGEIYDGEMCTRILKNVEAVGMSLVTSPVQKYSVVFLNDPQTGETIDHYDYTMVEFVIKRLQSPFHNWDINWTKKRHPHSRYNHINKNDKCPCESGKKYENCCLNKEGVLRPHCNVNFSVDPPKNLSMFEFSKK